MSKMTEIEGFLKGNPAEVYPLFHCHKGAVELLSPNDGIQKVDFCVALRRTEFRIPPYAIDRLNDGLDALSRQVGFKQVTKFRKDGDGLFYGHLLGEEVIYTSLNGLLGCDMTVDPDGVDIGPDDPIEVLRDIWIHVLPCKLLLKRHAVDAEAQTWLDNPTAWDQVMLSTIR